MSLPPKLSIEHLLPQSWRDHWPLPAEADPVQAEAERTARIDRLGNLTLVSGALNSSLSNGEWAKKRQALATNSLLLLNRRVTEREVWDEAAIDERGLALAKQLCNLWSGPEAPVWAPESGTAPGLHASFGTTSAIDASEVDGSTSEPPSAPTESFAAIDAAVRFARYALHGHNPAVRGTDQRPAAASRGDHIAVREAIIAELGGKVTREALLAAAGFNDYRVRLRGQPATREAECRLASSSDREVSRGDVVPMHRMPRIRRGGTPACRPTEEAGNPTRDARVPTWTTAPARPARSSPGHGGDPSRPAACLRPGTPTPRIGP